MKIAIVTPVFPPYTGGIGNVAFSHAQMLQQRGHAVEVFTPEYPKTQPIESDFVVHWVKPLMTYGNAALLPNLSRQLSGFDIVHLHYPFFGGAEMIWLHHQQIKKSDANIVLHYHMDPVGRGLFKIIFKILKLVFLKQVLKMSDTVIVTSLDYAKQSDVKRYFKRHPQKFVAVPNGVDTNKFLPLLKDNELLSEHHISLAEKIILFVGGLDKAHYFKGIPYLLAAVSRLQDKSYPWKLIIVGYGDLMGEYRQLAKNLQIDQRVVFAGKVASDELPNYYNLADVVVLPSIDKSEAFGLVLIEAMACAKPVVASNLPGVRSVVDDGINGYLVTPRNSQALAEKISYLLEHRELTAEFGLASRRKVEEQYGWEKIAKELDNLYKDL